MVDELSNLSTVVRAADPKDKAELYGRMGLRLTYRPDTRKVEARIEPDLHHMYKLTCPRGDLNPHALDGH